MRHRSETWVRLALRGRFSMETKVRIGAVEYTAISAPKIDRSLMSDPLSVGNCISATLNLSILTDDSIPASASVVVLGRLKDGNTHSEWKEFGTFFINQRDTSYEGLVTLSCYDAMLKANQNFLDGSLIPSLWPRPMKTVVEEIANRIGVSIDPRTRINIGADYVVSRPTDLTMIQVLGYIGACHGGNWIITEENALRLVPLVTAPDITYHVISHDYETIRTGDNSVLVYKEQEVYNRELPAPSGTVPTATLPATDAADNGVINVPVVLGQITKGTAVLVTGVVCSDTNGNSYTTGNKSGSVITISSNPYVTRGICNALYTAFNGLVYEPYTATRAVYDPATELGDQVKISDKVHSVVCGANMTLDLGFHADINAPNSEELSDEYPYLSDFQKLNRTIAASAEELTQKINSAGTSATNIASALTAEVNRASSAETELETRIGDEERRAKRAEEDIASRIGNIEDANPSAVAGRVSALETTVGNQGTAIGENASSIEGLSQGLASANTAIGAVQEKATAHDTSIANLVSKDGEHDTAISGLQETVGGHTTSIAALVEKDTAHDTSIGNLQSNITALQGKDTEHDNAISGLDGRVSANETAISAIQGVNTAQQTAIDTLGTRLTGDETILSEYESAITALQTTVANLLGRVAALEALISGNPDPNDPDPNTETE